MRTLRRGCFNPLDVNNPKNGEPIKIRFQKFISFIQSDVEEFTEFNGTIIFFFKSEQKPPENCF